MDWLEYKEKMGIATNDDERFKTFAYNIVNTLKLHTVYPEDGLINIQEYLDFCNTTGSNYDPKISNSQSSRARMRACIKILQNHAHNTTEFIACYIALINSFEVVSQDTCGPRVHDAAMTVLWGPFLYTDNDSIKSNPATVKQSRFMSFRSSYNNPAAVC